MYTDLYLKTENENDMEQKLLHAGFKVVEQKPYYEGTVVDIIGDLFTTEINLEEENHLQEYKIKKVQGFHVNIRTESEELVKNLSDIRVYPKTPSRKWI